MKNVKGMVVLVLAMALMFVIVGCAQPATSLETAAAPAAEPAAEPTAEKKTIAYLVQTMADDFAVAQNTATRNYIEALGYELIFVDSQYDAATQASQVLDMIEKKVDAIVMIPVDADAQIASIEAINEAGIPVALIDHIVNGGDYVAWVGSNNYDCGYAGGVQLAESAKAQGIALADLKVVELQGDLQSSSGLDRSNGFQQAAKDMGFSIVTSLPTNWETDISYNAAMDALQANPDVNAFWLPSDGVMADAILNAFEQVDKLHKVGEEGHVIVVSIDGTPGVIEHIKEGYIDATVSNPATSYGPTAVDYVIKAMAGEVAMDAKKEEYIPPVIGTIDNIDSPDLWANAK